MHTVLGPAKFTVGPELPEPTDGYERVWAGAWTTDETKLARMLDEQSVLICKYMREKRYTEMRFFDQEAIWHPYRERYWVRSYAEMRGNQTVPSYGMVTLKD